MKETFVNNIDELMTANENQRIKINYLESQKQKRQEYLAGLRESIMLNKQTLIVLNQQASNDQAISASAKQNLHLIKINQALYTENRQLNASLLMEQQLRVEQRAFNSERIAQFENRITDLRKYLHDKEETFSAVVTRLKKYEEFSEKPLSQKIQDTEGLKKITNQVLAQVMAERNMLKAKFEEVFPNAQRFDVLSKSLKNPANAFRFVSEINRFSNENKAFSECSSPREKLAGLYVANHKNAFSKQAKQNGPQMKQSSEKLKELMRLLKKEKVNNQILESALHSAIEKNEELLKINQNLEMALTNLEKKMEKLIGQNNFYKMKVKEFGHGYGKKYVLKRWKETGDLPGFHELLKLNFEIKDEQNEEVSGKVYRDLLKLSLREDVDRLLMIPLRGPKINEEKMGMRREVSMEKMRGGKREEEKMSGVKREEDKVKNAQVQRLMMVRCASEPRIFVEWEDMVGNEEYEPGESHEEMVIEEF